MDIGSIFLILALLILVVLFISRPFFERKATSVSQEEHELSSLLAERDRTINALRELEFDNALGKIPEEDYPAQRAALVQHGAEILRQLDMLQKQTISEPAEDRLEAALAARRIATQVAVPTNGKGVQLADDDMETIIASRRRARQEKSAGFCHNCGGPLQKSDRFCPKCGTQIETSS